MAIEYVNGVQNYNTNYATSIAAPAVNHTAGNLIVVIATSGYGDTTNITQITDTAGNTYVRITGAYDSSNTNNIEIWYAKNITGNANNIVTILYNLSRGKRSIHVLQYSGCDTTAPLDQSAVGTGPSSTTVITADITTTTADEVLVAGDVLSIPQTHTAGAGYTIRTIYGGSEPSKGDTEDKIVSSIGTYNASYSLGANAGWAIVMATFKAAAAGGLSIPVAMNHYRRMRES